MFRLNPIGNAFSSLNLEENEHLIQAFEENFLELFYQLATELKITFEQLKVEGKKIDK